MKKTPDNPCGIVLDRGNNVLHRRYPANCPRKGAAYKTKHNGIAYRRTGNTDNQAIRDFTYPKNLPYCGYGHRIWPGENLPRHRALTEREADALLRKDFAKLCAMYSHLGKDSVLAAALAYNIGPGAVNKSTFYKKTEAWRPQHLPRLHLPLPLPRQIPQRSVHSQIDRISCIVCAIIYKIPDKRGHIRDRVCPFAIFIDGKFSYEIGLVKPFR